jgi:multiple sugar transport system permease protein
MRKPTGQSILLYTLLVLASLVFLTPFYGMVITSVKTQTQIQDVSSLKGLLIARPFQWENYPNVFRSIPFLLYYWNTFYVTALSIFGCVLSCSLVAYGFARFRWPGRDVVFLIMLCTMMLPPQVTLIPTFILFSKLGWVNSFKPLWVPPYFGIPFSIFLLRQFLLGIPRDLEEAAKIDGCTPYGIFWRVMLPLIKPALLAVMVFEFLWAWNDFVGPLIYLHDDRLMTLTLGLLSFQWLHGTEWNLLMAAATMMTLPTIGIFFLAQRYFIEGITLTGLKG